MRHEASRRPRVVGELARPVFFVGFMGAGKTSVARRLARTCGVASVDMDTYLERREGKRVKEIFAQAGEDGFRAIETEDVYKRQSLHHGGRGGASGRAHSESGENHIRRLRHPLRIR